MIEYKGKYAEAKVFLNMVEETAASQIMSLLNHPISENANPRFMPDTHAGAGCVIGTTMLVGNIVIPNLVGVDIGCGVFVFELGDKDINLVKLDNFIHNDISSGYNVNNKIDPLLHDNWYNIEADVEEISVKIKTAGFPKGGGNFERHKRALGSMGGGNHFFEIAKDSSGVNFLLIHSGSRKFGQEVALHHQKKAQNYVEEKHIHVDRNLSYLEGVDAREYLEDMLVAQHFAILNRIALAKCILDFLDFKMDCWDMFKSDKSFETVHNYIDHENNILRKGAVSAQLEERLMIPFNMLFGSFLCKGKGNADWNFSAPHGAGRLMSRKRAKVELNIEDFREEMYEAGVFSTCINKSTLDESPRAYKDAQEIEKLIEPTVEIIDHLEPIYNYKDSTVDESEEGKSYDRRMVEKYLDWREWRRYH